MLQVSMRLPLGGPDPFGKAPTEDMILTLTYQGHRQVVHKPHKHSLILSQHGTSSRTCCSCTCFTQAALIILDAGSGHQK